MSREIKFRAWNKDNNRFTGRFCIGDDGSFIDMTSGDSSEWKVVEDMAIDRYTGLKDKNGVEIYEGDILRGSAYKYPIEVRHGKYICSADDSYEDESFGFYGISKMPNSEGYFDTNPLNFEWSEVIGNIYENSDLLEGKK